MKLDTSYLDKKVLKVFISQPMSGLSVEEVMQTRARATDIIKKRYPFKEIEVIDDNEIYEGIISTTDSKIKMYVIPTNEELEIANETMELVK